MLIVDTPLSKAASAAQGYVELAGTQKLIPGTVRQSPLSSTPCTWYYCTIHTTGRHSEEIFSELSTEPFLLEDNSGICLIAPNKNAKIYTPHIKRWRKGFFITRAYHEELLLPDTPLFVAGTFRTAHIEDNTDSQLNTLIKKIPKVFFDSYPNKHINIVTSSAEDNTPFILSAKGEKLVVRSAFIFIILFCLAFIFFGFCTIHLSDQNLLDVAHFILKNKS